MCSFFLRPEVVWAPSANGRLKGRLTCLEVLGRSGGVIALELGALFAEPLWGGRAKLGFYSGTLPLALGPLGYEDSMNLRTSRTHNEPYRVKMLWSALQYMGVSKKTAALIWAPNSMALITRTPTKGTESSHVGV